MKAAILPALAVLLGVALILSVRQDLSTGVVYAWHGATSTALTFWFYVVVESVSAAGLIAYGLARLIGGGRTRHRV